MSNLPRHLATACAGLLLAAPPLLAQDEKLETCDAPIGTLAVVEPDAQTIRALGRYGLSSPTTLIRMYVQHSNCFTVVERGAGLQTMERERALARSGELQQGSNVGPGQMVAADYILTPNVIFSEGNSGGIGAAAGSVLGRRRAIGALAGGLKFKEAQTSMLVGETRSGVQVAAAEGHARATDFRIAALGIGGGALGALGGYTNTNEGKVIAASYLDNYNAIVTSMRGNPAFAGGTADAPAPGAVFNEGDVVAPKLDNVKLLSGPSDGSAEVATLSKGEDLVYLGAERDGFLQVHASAGAGWVRAVLVARK